MRFDAGLDKLHAVHEAFVPEGGIADQGGANLLLGIADLAELLIDLRRGDARRSRQVVGLVGAVTHGLAGTGLPSTMWRPALARESALV